MFIKNFGLFWRGDEIDWFPGKGNKGAFRLLGRQNANRPILRMADFRYQQGIYILYGNHGPYYVGLTMQGLGIRLKNHQADNLAGQWDRFSWFGFCSVLKGTDKDGLQQLGRMAKKALARPDNMIRDVEALLIRAMGLRNINQSNFSVADPWIQVKLDEVDTYFDRLW